jgi:hypothetical protein
MATAKRSAVCAADSDAHRARRAIESNSWNGLLAPAGTPDAVVQRMNAEVNKALASPAVTEAFHKGGIASLSGTPERFADFIQSEIAKYGDVIRRANIQLRGLNHEPLRDAEVPVRAEPRADVQRRYAEGGDTRDTLLAGYDLDDEEREAIAMATSASSTCWDATASC